MPFLPKRRPGGRAAGAARRIRPAAAMLLLGLSVAPARAQVPAVPGTWSTAAPVPEARTEVGVTTDGRRLYLIGGFGPSETGRASAPRAMLAYDPAADAWTRLGDIPEGVNHAGFVHHRGRLYIVGGFREATFEPVGNLRIYDIASRSWTEGPPMPTPRGAMAVAVHDGRIHAIGGNAANAGSLAGHEHHVGGDGSSVGTHEVFDIATGRWSRLAPMPTARNHHAAVALNGRIHVVAGRVGADAELTTHEIYHPTADTWSIGAPVPTGRSGVAAVAFGGHLYLFGGETFAGGARTFHEAERYDPATNRWASLPRMPTARHGLGAAVLGDAIHVVSGGPRAGFSFGTVHEVLRLD
jgi:N-acetylneuraminic acid mutarotase